MIRRGRDRSEQADVRGKIRSVVSAAGIDVGAPDANVGCAWRIGIEKYSRRFIGMIGPGSVSHAQRRADLRLARGREVGNPIGVMIRAGVNISTGETNLDEQRIGRIGDGQEGDVARH